jgi:hypothetical protein
LISLLYFIQGSRTSCCINWYDRRTSYVSFTFFLFFVVYCIPLIILVASNTITLRGLKQMHDKIEHGIQTSMNKKRIEMERRIIKSELCSFPTLFSCCSCLLSYGNSRYYNNNMWFHIYLDTLCCNIVSIGLSWQRLCSTTNGHLLLCMLR